MEDPTLPAVVMEDPTLLAVVMEDPTLPAVVMEDPMLLSGLLPEAAAKRIDYMVTASMVLGISDTKPICIRLHDLKIAKINTTITWFQTQSYSVYFNLIS